MSDKKFSLILVGLLSLFAVFSSFSLMLKRQEPATEKTLNASIYNNKISGYRGWHKTIELAHIENQVWQQGFEHLDKIEKPSTMVIIQPKMYISKPGEGYQKTLPKETLDKLLQWVAKGGHTLVFMDSFDDGSGYELLKKLQSGNVWKKNQDPGIRPQYTLEVPARYSSRLKRHITKPIITHTLSRIETLSRRSKAPSGLLVPSSSQTLLSDASKASLIEKYRLGKGVVIIGTVADMASNRFLLDTGNDNLQFFTNLLLLERKPLIINEFVHGYLQTPDLFSYYMKTPLTPMLYQVIFLFFLLLWFSFKPWRPPYPASKDINDMNIKKFVQSMSGIYLKTNASSLALGPQLVVIEQTLRRRYCIKAPGFTTVAEADKKLQHLLERLSPDYSNKQTFFQALQEARQIVNWQQSVSPKKLVYLSQMLTLIQERLHHGIPSSPSTH